MASPDDSSLLPLWKLGVVDAVQEVIIYIEYILIRISIVASSRLILPYNTQQSFNFLPYLGVRR